MRRDLVTVVGSAASVTPGEFIECIGNWHNDRTYGLQFKTIRLTVVLIYTAVTRGKKLVIIIGEPKALAMAVKNQKSNSRMTNLTSRIAAEKVV